MRGAGLESGLRAPNLMFPGGVGLPRRELTPVRLCFVRLSWRQRARPSTTLHEIQICRSRLEYIGCNTPFRALQLSEHIRRELPFAGSNRAEDDAANPFGESGRIEFSPDNLVRAVS